MTVANYHGRPDLARLMTVDQLSRPAGSGAPDDSRPTITAVLPGNDSRPTTMAVLPGNDSRPTTIPGGPAFSRKKPPGDRTCASPPPTPNQLFRSLDDPTTTSIQKRTSRSDHFAIRQPPHLNNRTQSLIYFTPCQPS
jgi:hypothetical protein